MTNNPKGPSEISRHHMVAMRILDHAPDSDLLVLQDWAEGLLSIQKSNVSRFQKAKSAIALTNSRKIVRKFVKAIALSTKKIIWDDSSKVARLGMGGAAVGVAVFGGKAAGVAALGTAIGVPLWVVLGAGAAFAGVLADEIKRRIESTKASATYTVIDAAKENSMPK